jgi:Ham1 family
MEQQHIDSQQSAISNQQSTIPTLLIATSNKGKVAEIASLLEGLEGSDCRVIGLEDLPQVPPPVEETGTTFAENAILKADALGRFWSGSGRARRAAGSLFRSLRRRRFGQRPANRAVAGRDERCARREADR